VDLDAIRRFALKVWKFKEGELVAVMIHVGDRLGIFKAMAGEGPMTAAQVASAVETDERWTTEWLYGQAAAGILDHADGTFELTDVAAAVLADESGSAFFAGGAFTETTSPTIIDQLVHAMREGGGFTYEDQGEAATVMTERMSQPSVYGFFLPVVIPAIAGLKDRLVEGVEVVEVGSGSGVALNALARKFTASRFVGVEPSTTAVARARVRTADIDNIEFIEGKAEELTGAFDVALALDTLHDMPHPDKALLAIHQALRPEGVLVIKDVKSKAGFENNLKNPVLAMQYGFSLVSCLASGLSEPDGMGLGTLGFNPDVAERLVSAAGFSEFRMHDLDDPTQLYYEARP